ncbi:phosphoribosylformylglycinamidine synthase subunit PurQ [bacterium]|nr:phosphoribosylformylglycinamidine synthase subunit PurQ [bacterium]
MSLKVAVITFPGSNCDQDMHRAVKLMGWDLVKLWHSDVLTEPVDLIAVPGGFSYGDYLRCGALARFSRAMESVREHASRGGLVLGVCNGFQILCEAGLLPGALHRNSGLKFRCLWTDLVVKQAGTAFSNAASAGQRLRVPIAHGEGNYFIDNDGLKSLQDNGQVVFEYADNPNGSVASIAGIMNREGNVLGMMPHPERAMETELGGVDGRVIFDSLMGALAKA